MTDDPFCFFSFSSLLFLFFWSPCLGEQQKSPDYFSLCSQIIGLWGVHSFIQQIGTEHPLGSRRSQCSCAHSRPIPAVRDSGRRSCSRIRLSAHLTKAQRGSRFQEENAEARAATEFITCPTTWFPNRPNVTDWVLLTLPSCFCRSELTVTFQELDISFPTKLRLLLCFLLFSSKERVIALPKNISALLPDNLSRNLIFPWSSPGGKRVPQRDVLLLCNITIWLRYLLENATR